MKITLVIITTILLASLLWWKWPHLGAYLSPPSPVSIVQTTQSWGAQYQKAYFAAGCFWCAESSFEKYPGVIGVTSGYAGGTEETATYKQVGKDDTGHREAIEVIYDPNIIDYDDLLQIFWRTADPTDEDGQYVDRGFQYSSAIWYQTDWEKDIAEGSKIALGISKRFGDSSLVTPVIKYVSFYPAEAYHQDYYKVNPLHYKAYTSWSGRPEYQKKIWGSEYKYFTKKEKNTTKQTSMKVLPTQEELKIRLTPLQYSVTQEADTERPFDNEYHDNKREGIYVDIVSGEALYSSLDKYDSGTGWPSFTRPIADQKIALHEDKGFFTTRTEVRGALSDAHLGHVFDDGPTDRGGKRYCMNSAAMKFISVSDLEKDGYGEYRGLFTK